MLDKIDTITLKVFIYSLLGTLIFFINAFLAVLLYATIKFMFL